MTKVPAPDRHLGRLTAQLLAGSWRPEPPPLVFEPDDLAAVAPGIIGCGAGALAWNRLAHAAALKELPDTLRFRDVNRHLALQAAIKEPSIGAIAGLFAAAGMEPILFKGWALARHYAAPHWRPFGDIDLCAPPGRYAEAVALLHRHAVPGSESPRHGLTHAKGQFQIDLAGDGSLSQIDLHEDLDRYRMAAVATLYARAPRTSVNGHAVRVLAGEDHLRLVALHFLMHGGWRPVWLMDVAVLLETLPQHFNWTICLGEEPRVAHWIACVLELAHGLLGADRDRIPPAHRIDRLPAWLERTILSEWRAPFAARFMARPLSDVARNPMIMREQFRIRWPNRIKATTYMDGRFDARPRLPYQLALVTRQITGRVARGAATLTAR